MSVSQFELVQGDSELLLPEIERPDRFKVIADEFGFVPTSTRELLEAFSLLAFSRQGGGAARHLNEVLRHQQKAKAKHEAEAAEIAHFLCAETIPLIDIDPEAAVKSITRDYIEFYRDAARGYNSLVDLADRVQDIDNPHLSLTDEVPDMGIALGYLTRHIVLNKRKLTDDTVDLAILKPYESDFFGSVFRDPGLEVRAVSSEVKIRDARTLVGDAAHEQIARFDFWGEQLQQATRHSIVRGMASQALDYYSGTNEK